MSHRILVVEDDLASQELFVDLLEHAGYTVRRASTVEEGRAQLAAAVPDAVVMDVRLPGGGGPSLLGVMRSDAQLANVPVMAVTAFAMAGDRERLLEAGFDRYMSKPIRAAAFLQGVEELLRLRRGG